MTPVIVWSCAAIFYLLFWLWYVGMRSRIKPAEIEANLAQIKANGSPSDEWLADLRQFFEQDDGRDFVMVNLLELRAPIKESQKKLAQYQKIFLGRLLKRAGHPVFFARVAGGQIENIGCNDDRWQAAAMVRYRSRRDLMETLVDTAGSAHHALKLEALTRTFAYPATPWTISGGPKLIVFLSIALIAALTHLFLGENLL